MSEAKVSKGQWGTIRCGSVSELKQEDKTETKQEIEEKKHLPL